MALTPSRWIVALLLVIASTLALVPQPGEPGHTRLFRPRTPEVAAHSRARQHLNRAKATLAVARQRDAAVALLDGPADEPWLLHVGKDLPQSVVRYLSAQFLRDQAVTRQVSDPLLPAAFVAIADSTIRGYPLGTGSLLILPSDSTPRCVALLRLGSLALRRLDDGVAAEAALHPRSSSWHQPIGLGGCAWFALFGRPGPTVGRWLAATGYAYAGVVPGDTAKEPTPVASIDSLRRRGVGIIGLACSVRNQEACKQVLMGRAVQRFFVPSWRVPDDMAIVQPVPGGFGPAQFHYLADMLTDIGPEVFQQFWSSNLPIEEAFRDATGAELIDWTHSWARRNIGAVQAGPMPTLPAMGIASLVVLLGFSVGIARAGRRGSGAAGQ